MKRLSLCIATLSLLAAPVTRGADLLAYHGDPIIPDVETVYLKGLNFLVKTQSDDGTWEGQYGREPGIVGLAVLAMLAHGDDPNFGPYSKTIRKSLGFILGSANSQNGYIGSSMYNHGFATLALAEAYGSVDEPRLGPALKKAVDLIISAQARNGMGGWRYSPESMDSDTTVSGAQMVALYAAMNAGIPVPEKVIKKGLQFYRQCQGGDGGFGYTDASGTSGPRSAIGTLILALSKQKETTEFKSAFRALQQVSTHAEGYGYYYEYYAAQAFFHGNMDAWRTWNEINLKTLKGAQGADGSWQGNYGGIFSTSAALLSLAVNYRFLPIYER